MVLSLPLLSVAIWSRVWLGWGALGPVALAVAWVWWNPRAFAPPKRFDAWISHAVLGEYVFLKRKTEVAGHHLRMAFWLSVGSAPGAVIWIIGLWRLDADWVIFGMVLTAVPKMWFCDRMVWVYRDFRAGGGTVLDVTDDGLVPEKTT